MLLTAANSSPPCVLSAFRFYALRPWTSATFRSRPTAYLDIGADDLGGVNSFRRAKGRGCGETNSSESGVSLT